MRNIALFVPESDFRNQVLSKLEQVQLPVTVKMTDFEEIMANLAALGEQGISHALVAADFGTGRVGQNDGGVICLGIKKLAAKDKDYTVFPIGLSEHPLSGAMMTFSENQLDPLISILVGWQGTFQK
jgi:hypothetical protein